MRRVLVFLPALALVGLLVAPAQAADPVPIDSGTCSGYATTAKYGPTPSGNTYESKTNVCQGYSSYTTAHMPTASVERSICYLNGQPAARCRWTGTIRTMVDLNDTSGWEGLVSAGWCNSCGGAFLQDSDRRWSPVADLQTCSDCNRVLATVGKAEGGLVTFNLLDGTTKQVARSDRWSKGLHVP